jgi:hypothetical protein
VEDERQSMALAKDEMKAEFTGRQTQLELEKNKLQQKSEELKGRGKLNEDVQKQLDAEEKRLEAEGKKMSMEKKKREQAQQKQQEAHAQRMRVAEAKLALERKAIEDGKKELEKKERNASKVLQLRVPRYWKNKTGFHSVASSFVRDCLQTFMLDSSTCQRCPGAASRKTQVVSVERVENEYLWQMYQLRRDSLQKRLAAHTIRKLSKSTKLQPAIASTEMSADVNEFYLFHGTSLDMAKVICEHGFDERMANLTGLYGAGSYFAINACKSHQYSAAKKESSNFVMLVCRVTMGSPYCTSGQHPHERRPPENVATPGRPFDSIFAEAGIAKGGQQAHNEYVVFDRCQVYPEYVVHYRV